VALNSIRDRKKEKGHESLDEEMLDGMERQVADRQPTVEQEMVHEVKLREVRQAVEALPAKQRAAVLMHKYEGLDYAQIASVLDCSESALKSLLFRAYESLRGRLAHMV
jgi:RNA polymerase sigma-70 factor, ECF subfamily